MYINEPNLSWNGALRYGNVPQRIVCHHAEASRCSVYDVNQWHKNNGWTGIGYHYFVRKDGSIWRGRPENAIGAHCPGANTNSIGICAEGSYMTETMPQAQYNSIRELIANIRSRYGWLPIVGHREIYSTDCPGTNYPLQALKNNEDLYGSGSTISPSPSLKGYAGVVIANGSLNVRNKPNGEIIGSLPNGAQVDINPMCSQNGWYSIYYGNNGGFVSMDYVKVSYDQFFIVTNNLPYTSEDYKALNLEYIMPYFEGLNNIYFRSGSKMWIETRYVNDEEEKAIVDNLKAHNLFYEVKQEGDSKFVVSDFLPNAYEGYYGVSAKDILPLFNGVRCYIRSWAPNIWIETCCMSLRDCIQLKNDKLTTWVYDITK